MGGLDERALPHAQHLRAHDAGAGRDAGDADGDRHVRGAEAEHGDQRQRQQQARGSPARRRRRASRRRPASRARTRRRGRAPPPTTRPTTTASSAERIDSCGAVDGAGEQVATELVGAEQVRPTTGPAGGRPAHTCSGPYDVSHDGKNAAIVTSTIQTAAEHEAGPAQDTPGERSPGADGRSRDRRLGGRAPIRRRGRVARRAPSAAPSRCPARSCARLGQLRGSGGGAVRRGRSAGRAAGTAGRRRGSTTTNTAAPNSTRPCTTGMSCAATDALVSRPSPARENTVSVTTVPASSAPDEEPGHGQRRQGGVAQRVAEVDARPAGALGPRGVDVRLVERVLQALGEQLGDLGAGRQGQRDRREHDAAPALVADRREPRPVERELLQEQQADPERRDGDAERRQRQQRLLQPPAAGERGDECERRRRRRSPAPTRRRRSGSSPAAPRRSATSPGGGSAPIGRGRRGARRRAGRGTAATAAGRARTRGAARRAAAGGMSVASPPDMIATGIARQGVEDRRTRP